MMPEAESMPRMQMMSTADLRELMHPGESPCVSIYIPTIPAPAEMDQNRIRYRNQLQLVERELGIDTLADKRHSDLIAPLRQIEDDDHFWSGRSGTTALFRSPSEMRVRQVVREMGEFAVVADSFHLKPLIRAVQDAARFQLLAISPDQVALYEGDRQSLNKVALHPEVPRDMAEAIGEPARITKRKRSAEERESHDDPDDQLVRYFNRVDAAVARYHSRPANLPLILVALAEYQGFFHEHSENEFLLEGGIKRDPFHDLSEEKLHEEAWQFLQPFHQRRLAEKSELYGTAQAHGKGTDELEQAGRLAVFGQVGTLLIREDHRVGGTLDPGTGRITYQDMTNPLVDDVIDDIAEAVLRTDGEVLIADDEHMPTRTGIAAIQRF